MSDHRPIGVFDSGIGGLTVLRTIAGRLPAERLVYLGDTARVPYGTKSAATITRYSRQCASFLLARDVKALVVACNTASALALEDLRDFLRPRGVPVLGVIEPGAVEACRVSRSGRVGVIGTASTIGSGAYARAIAAIRPDFVVTGLACPLFVPLAEEGWTDPGDPVARSVAMRYLRDLDGSALDTLILGCTHYPLLRGVIEGALVELGHTPGELAVVDSAAAVAQDLVRALERLGLEAPASGKGTAEYFVTDDPGRFRTVGARFLGHEIAAPHLADLTDVPAHEDIAVKERS